MYMICACYSARKSCVQLISLDCYGSPRCLRLNCNGRKYALVSSGLGELEPFLASAMDPPEDAAVANAIERLEAIGALSPDESLTSLGELLARLPVDPAIGKLLILGAVFGCLEPVLSIAAALSHKSPFVIPMEKRGQADAARRRLAEPHRSDHWALLAALREWRRTRETGGNAHAWAYANFLQPNALQLISGMRMQLAEVRLACLACA